MTREEAINLLDLQLHGTPEQIEQHGSYEHATAIRMAIEALKAEPSGDAISRQAVLEQINCWIGNGEYRYTNATHYLTERVKHISSVKPQEPKTGHWITHPNGIYAHLVCDKCLSSAPYDCKTNFCPNCGAKMVDLQESEGKE